MKRIQSTLMASLLTVALSSVAMGGNIGGMRNSSDSDATEVSASGNIGGLAATNGNIGGLKSEGATDTTLGILGNIGGLVRIVFSTSTIW